MKEKSMTNEYLKTLYQDFAKKIKSIIKYIELTKNETGEIGQVTYAWIGKLRKKLEILEAFQKTRQHAVPATEFAIEQAAQPVDETKTNENIQAVDKEINDTSAQINYLFTKAEREVSFLVQSFQELQDLVNNIYDQFQDTFDKL
jgi:hypothetical protein